jgi:ABC-type sulfate/molybdate transport systems ATPase subunit
MDAPGVAAQSGPVRVFIRPHDWSVELKANGHPAFRATVKQLNAAGPKARLELTTDSGDVVAVEITQDRYRALNLHPGVQVFLVPRDLRLFADSAGGQAEREAAREWALREERILSPEGP